MGDLATRAFARILNINLWFLTEIWLPVRGYYSEDGSRAFLDGTKADRAKACDELASRATTKYFEAEEFGRLPALLRDLALRSTELGLNSFDDFWRVRKDKETIRLSNELKALLDRLAEPRPSPTAN